MNDAQAIAIIAAILNGQDRYRELSPLGLLRAARDLLSMATKEESELHYQPGGWAEMDAHKT